MGRGEQVMGAGKDEGSAKRSPALCGADDQAEHIGPLSSL